MRAKSIFRNRPTGSDSYSVTLPVRTSSSANTMLLVEDDTTAAAVVRLWPLADGLNSANRGFGSARAALVTAGTISLGDYGAVLWCCVNDSRYAGASLNTESATR